MKSLLIVVLLVLANSETPEQCVRGKCPDEVRECEKNTKCRTDALNCYNSCGKDFNNIKCLKPCCDTKSKNDDRLK